MHVEDWKDTVEPRGRLKGEVTGIVILGVGGALVALLIASLTLSGCAGIPIGTPSAGQANGGVNPAQGGASQLARIDAIASQSTCAKHFWPERDYAPQGFVKGVARSYARSVCRYKSAETTIAGVIGRPVGSSSTDALARYGLDADTGLERLRITYALSFGFGMRESSGKYCEGRDMSASNTSAETAEAGPFQASWNSRAFSGRLTSLMAWYQAHPEACDLEVWKEGVDPNSKSCRPNYGGSGQGLEFQKMERACPAFATEWALAVARKGVAHFGPLKRKEAEYLPSCADMLEQVGKTVTCAE